jgi:ATP-dependent DNA helicase RecG
MNRLLEGDVGSGKTMVAALAMLAVMQSGRQTALMAPTEILATQHFESFLDLWHSNIPAKYQTVIALLTKNEARISVEPELGHWISIKKPLLLKKIQSGEVGIVLGTHSLISEKVTYADLALTIVDEQHRFGVKQRAELQQVVKRAQDSTPETISHLLSMTATPIPRSLALSIYGDLDISLLDEYPPGRKVIKTRVVTNQQRLEAYAFIRKHIQAGRQAFVVCPKIESSIESDVLSVEEVYQKLHTEIFPDMRIKMIHGKLSSEEKDSIMRGFGSHTFDILVATSVIEVGVNIPNANIMVIEGAERFGLAQLHQFRGRVGRGEHQSFCLLFETGADSKVLNQRLIALEKASNGFELAELDLKLRGPGQFIGSHQSGLADMSMLALTDIDLIQDARQAANKLLSQDMSLRTYPDLKHQLQHFRETVHFE